MDETTGPEHPVPLPARIETLLGRVVPVDGEAWSSAAESLDYRDESEEIFDLAETMPHGPDRDAVLQRAHDAMRLAEDWEQQAVDECADLPDHTST